MQSTDIPTQRWSEVWGKNTPGSNIRTIPLTTATPGFASQDQGFPPINALPIAGGGIPPFVQDMNGALQFISSWAIWLTAGGAFVPWNSAFSTAIGGYPKGAVVASATTANQNWISLVENNTSNPDAGGANWQGWGISGFSSGDVKPTYKTVADSTWIMMDDGTIGNAGSGASNRANADTQPLFSIMYNNMNDTNCPIQTSAGAPTTRGAQGTAAAAFAALCRLVLPKTLGRTISVAGLGSGLTSRPLGSIVGTETQTLVTANVPPHTHGYRQTQVSTIFTQAGGGPANEGDFAGTTDSGSGSSTPFSIMDPGTFMNAMVKL